MDNVILSLLYNKYNYKKYSSLIREEYLTDDYRSVFADLDRYFEEEIIDDKIDWLKFKQWFLLIAHPNLADGKAQAISAVCDRLAETEIPTDGSVLTNLNTRHFARLISERALDISTGNGSMEDIRDLIREFSLEVKNINWDADSITSNDQEILALLKGLKHGPRYNWSIPELNLMCGTIGLGDFVILAARPDGGKTTFMACQAVHFAKQLKDGEVLLWCNNEEPRERVAARRLQAGLGWSREEIDKSHTDALKAFQDRIGKDRIISLDKPNMTVYDIEAALDTYSPKVIIIDQIWKLGGFEQAGTTAIERYAKLSAYVRGLAAKHGPIIGASQLDASADNERFPEIGSLYGSKTAVQGEADAIILIGQDKEEGADIRFLRAPKNKLPYAHKDFRSTGCAVKIDKERAQFISMIGSSHANTI
jgi:replicative DNA helicase